MALYEVVVVAARSYVVEAAGVRDACEQAEDLAYAEGGEEWRAEGVRPVEEDE